MGKCIGRYSRVENFDPSIHTQAVYDKFGNLISGGTGQIVISHRGRKLILTQQIQVKKYFFIWLVRV